jgi:hypothetical protein
VRRFVTENQGLIRRMYGEVRQLSVLRMEIDRHEELTSNSIEDSHHVPLSQPISLARSSGSSSSEAVEINVDDSGPSSTVDEKTVKSGESGEDGGGVTMTTGLPTADDDVPVTTTASVATNTQVYFNDATTTTTVGYNNLTGNDGNSSSASDSSVKTEQVVSEQYESSSSAEGEDIQTRNSKPALKAV